MGCVWSPEPAAGGVDRHDWFSGGDTDQLAASLRRFVGTNGYDLTQLRTDIACFTLLLGTDDGTQLFGTDQH